MASDHDGVTEYRPGMPEQIWIRVLVPGLVVGFFTASALSAIRDDEPGTAGALVGVAVVVAGVAFVLDSRTAWVVRLSRTNLRLVSRWRTAVVPLDQLRIVEVSRFPWQWVIFEFDGGRRTMPLVRQMDDLLAELRQHAPLASIRDNVG